MNVLILTFFVSIILAVGGIVLYVYGFKAGSHEHLDRLALLPLEDDVFSEPPDNALGSKP